MGTQSREGLTMVHMLTSVTLVLLSLELTHSAPFLLDLLPQLQLSSIRREGKSDVDTGYGAPEAGYGAPESSAYEAPSYSSTVRPCIYEAPAPAPEYGAPEPGYGAPEQQKKPGFPDIFGFIGGVLSGSKKNPEPNTGYGCLSPPVESGYGAPQTDSYEAPQKDSYGTPLAAPVNGSVAYEAPQTDVYEAPQSETYEAPQSNSYEAPQSDSYEAPQSNAYDAPEVTSYDAPEISVNGRSNAPSI